MVWPCLNVILFVRHFLHQYILQQAIFRCASISSISFRFFFYFIRCTVCVCVFYFLRLVGCCCIVNFAFVVLCDFSRLLYFPDFPCAHLYFDAVVTKFTRCTFCLFCAPQSALIPHIFNHLIHT